MLIEAYTDTNKLKKIIKKSIKHSTLARVGYLTITLNVQITSPMFVVTIIPLVIKNETKQTYKQKHKQTKNSQTKHQKQECHYLDLHFVYLFLLFCRIDHLTGFCTLINFPL